MVTKVEVPDLYILMHEADQAELQKKGTGAALIGQKIGGLVQQVMEGDSDHKAVMLDVILTAIGQATR